MSALFVAFKITLCILSLGYLFSEYTRITTLYMLIACLAIASTIFLLGDIYRFFNSGVPGFTETGPVSASTELETSAGLLRRAMPPRPRDCTKGEPVFVGTKNAWVCISPGSGTIFKDCPNCPEMTVVPAGDFQMGLSPGIEMSDDGPLHAVKVRKPFAAGTTAITFAQWDACAASGGCGGYSPSDEGWGRGDHPVIHVNWDDAKSYISWLTGQTGAPYRLLTETEREYVTTAGQRRRFWWGASISPEQANYDGNHTYEGERKGLYRRKTVPAKSFSPNPWGLYQVHGNVWEWVEDCAGNYLATADMSAAWVFPGCDFHSLRGGSWNSTPQALRATYRYSGARSSRRDTVGFRVARDLDPGAP
jgi:formylglycine-generating enzyme required for sulfatase activity